VRKKRTGKRRTRATLRNPVAPAVRALHPRVKPSGKDYKRKPKHKGPGPDDGGSRS